MARDNTAVYHTDPVTKTADSASPPRPDGSGLGVLHFEFSTSVGRPPVIHGDASVVFAENDPHVHHGVDLLLRHAHPDDRFRVLSAFESTLGGGPPLNISFRAQCPVSHTCKTIHARASFEADVSSPESGLIRGVLIDLTGVAENSHSSLEAVEPLLDCTVLLMDPSLQLLSISGDRHLFETVFERTAEEALSLAPRQTLSMTAEGTPLHEICRIVCEGALSRRAEPEVRFWRSRSIFVEFRGLFIEDGGQVALSVRDHSLRRRLTRETRIGQHRANLLVCIKSLHDLVTQMLGSEYLSGNGGKPETATMRLDMATRLLKLLAVTAEQPEHLPNSPFEVLLWSCHRYVFKVVDSPRLSFDTSLLRLRTVRGELRIDQVVAVLSGLQECGAHWIEFSCPVPAEGEERTLEARAQTQEAIDVARMRQVETQLGVVVFSEPGSFTKPLLQMESPHQLLFRIPLGHPV